MIGCLETPKRGSLGRRPNAAESPAESSSSGTGYIQGVRRRMVKMIEISPKMSNTIAQRVTMEARHQQLRILSTNCWRDIISTPRRNTGSAELLRIEQRIAPW